MSVSESTVGDRGGVAKLQIRFSPANLSAKLGFGARAHQRRGERKGGERGGVAGGGSVYLPLSL